MRRSGWPEVGWLANEACGCTLLPGGAGRCTVSVSLVIFNEDRPEEDEMTSVNATHEALLDELLKDSTGPQDILGQHARTDYLGSAVHPLRTTACPSMAC